MNPNNDHNVRYHRTPPEYKPSFIAIFLALLTIGLITVTALALFGNDKAGATTGPPWEHGKPSCSLFPERDQHTITLTNTSTGTFNLHVWQGNDQIVSQPLAPGESVVVPNNLGLKIMWAGHKYFMNDYLRADVGPWCVPNPPTTQPPPTTAPPTTSTTAPSTTSTMPPTTQPPTTTVPSTTSTTPTTSATTVPTTVPTSTTLAPTTSALATSVTLAPTTTSTEYEGCGGDSSCELPATGSGSGHLVLGGLAAIAMGGISLLSARRRGALS